MGQPMQILPEQPANQQGRQPLQRSGLPLVTARRDPEEEDGCWKRWEGRVVMQPEGGAGGRGIRKKDPFGALLPATAGIKHLPCQSPS